LWKILCIICDLVCTYPRSNFVCFWKVGRRSNPLGHTVKKIWDALLLGFSFTPVVKHLEFTIQTIGVNQNTFFWALNSNFDPISSMSLLKVPLSNFLTQTLLELLSYIGEWWYKNPYILSYFLKLDVIFNWLASSIIS
jgi:hypothetical protein